MYQKWSKACSKGCVEALVASSGEDVWGNLAEQHGGPVEKLLQPFKNEGIIDKFQIDFT